MRESIYIYIDIHMLREIRDDRIEIRIICARERYDDTLASEIGHPRDLKIYNITHKYNINKRKNSVYIGK